MRLFTYNIHKGIGNDRIYRLARIIDVIENENPDLVCLQEVARGTRRSHRQNQARLIMQALGGFHMFYQLNVHLRPGGYGNLILSRWPFLEKHRISLRRNNKKPRGAQLVIVDTPEGPLHLVNWHLGLAEKDRHWQAGRLIAHRLFRSAENYPTMLIGDTNDWRNSLIKGVLGAYGFEHVTNPISRFRSYPSYLPVGSLDKAYFSGKLRVKYARVVRTRQSRNASDHLPLVVDFHLNGTR